MTPESDNRDRARELLGGLASGILTPEERQTLFKAALHDQNLFNEVADELEFAAFLKSPETRVQLANKIEVEPERRSWIAAKSRWLALTGALAAASVVFVALWNRPGHPTAVEPPHQEEVAAAAPAAPPVDQPAQQAPQQAMTAPRRPAPKHPTQPPAMSGGGGGGDRGPARSPVPALPAPAGVGGAAFRAAMPAALSPLLTGTVHDQAGVAVANATIQIRDPATDATTQTKADASGRFAVPSVGPGGPYTVTAQAPGFKAEQRAGITLAANQPVALDIPLQVGSTAESVMVTAASAPVPAAPPAQQVAVLDFVNGTPQSQSGQQVADLVSNQLLDRGQVRIIDRQKVKQALEQQPKQPSSAKDAAALGRALGADAVITGSVKPDQDKAADHVAVSAQVIDTRKARAMANVAAHGPSIQNAANRVGLQLESQLAAPLAGSVTRVEGALVTVNFSSTAPPHIGIQLDVFRGPRKIGELTLRSAYGNTGAGTYTGTTPPRKGDRIASPR